MLCKAYSKRALPTLIWIAAQGKQHKISIPVRLVKGAYWDNEIKWAQQQGLKIFLFLLVNITQIEIISQPLNFLLAPHIQPWIKSQFATHNIHTIYAISSLAANYNAPFEMQRLYGMGDMIYQSVDLNCHNPVRIYAPIGQHEDLLPYLVRRLLENGANSSFIHHVMNPNYAAEDLVRSPFLNPATTTTPQISIPPAIFKPARLNSLGMNIGFTRSWLPFQAEKHRWQQHQWQAHTFIAGENYATERQDVTNPANQQEIIGEVSFAQPHILKKACHALQDFLATWADTSIAEKQKIMLNFADLLQKDIVQLMMLCHKEAGKTTQDSWDEVREAIDFCRYYAHQATQYTQMQGHGVVACISPWNFPLAIFVGQICAALLAGNTVLAKPAPQTSLMAYHAMQLWYKAGLPHAACALIIGDHVIGDSMTAQPTICGIAFTGSLATAKHIQQKRYEQDTLPQFLIAETGGLNAMIVDSTALLEQAATDIIRSAFASAGQRCSALRVLFVQKDIADRLDELLKGMLDELKIGDPCDISTDIGPLIDANARQKMQQHVEKMRHQQFKIYTKPLKNTHQNGFFYAPHLIEIPHISSLKDEAFGPALHVIRYDLSDLEQQISSIAQTGFGLTLGIHSRNQQFYTHILNRLSIGNCYVNRDQIGAVVESQPFGGQGYSGTGPKAGGPNYLPRFAQHFQRQSTARVSAHE